MPFLGVPDNYINIYAINVREYDKIGFHIHNTYIILTYKLLVFCVFVAFFVCHVLYTTFVITSPLCSTPQYL